MSTDPYEAPTSDSTLPSSPSIGISRSEVIGWAFTAQAIFIYVVGLLSVIGSISHVEALFRSLHATLPAITQLVLRLGDGGVFVIATTIAAVPLVVMLKVPYRRAQVVIPIVSCLLQTVLLKLCIMAVMMPVLEVQKVLS